MVCYTLLKKPHTEAMKGGRVMDGKKIGAYLFFLAGGLFLLSAALGGSGAFYPLGFCFIVLGAGEWGRSGKSSGE